MTPNRIRAIVSVVLIALGAAGVISPDSDSNEHLVDSLVTGVGAVFLLFTDDPRKAKQ